MRGVYPAAAALIILLLGSAGISMAAEQASSRPTPPSLPDAYGPFQIHERLAPRVQFWVDVYAKYSSWEYAIHDVKHPQLVYTVLDTRGKPRGSVNVEKNRVARVLAGLVPKARLIREGKLARSRLKAEEAKFLALFEENGLLDSLPEAATPRRVRGQAGLKDSLEDALFISGRYLPRMKVVFERFDLPEEIAYLPFVESGFNKKAVSKVGASGIWQFMPYTGKLYLRVDDEVDERNDPMRAAEAAARLMRQNFHLLSEWPLAVTAYNHGAAGVARGVREVGSKELVDLIDSYQGRSFGFASQNFYASFLGALHVTKNCEAFLGSVPRARRLEFDEFVMPHFMELKTFLEKFSIDEATFRELNPALTQEVYSGRKYMPVGYTVRIPIEVRDEFFRKYESIPKHLKFAEQRSSEAPSTRAASTPASVEAAGLAIQPLKSED
jgi:membrane-bound lytic murein transglycosylase D